MRGFFLIAVACLGTPASAEEWREFRGPGGVGHYSGPATPTEWGVEKNVAWKVSVPGKGWSSPVVVGDKVFVTTAEPETGKPKEYKLAVLCYGLADGKQVWRTDVFVQPKNAPAGHAKNSHASPTPVSDGKSLFVHFGHMGTAALGLDGKILWKTQDHSYIPQHGNGGSPILVGDKLVFSIDGNDKQQVVALNASDGKVAWQTDRKSAARMKFTFTTPGAFEVGGKTLIVSAASDFVAAYDAADGKEIWRANYPTAGWSLITRPVMADGKVLISTGYTTPALMAIKPDGTGDVTKSHVAYTLKRNAPNTPTPLVVDSEAYMLGDGGILTCFDPKTGESHYSERLPGNYSSSPVRIGDNIFITNETGTGVVFKAGKKFEEVSRSDLKEKTYATIVPAEGRLLIRTETQLYCFRKAGS